MSNLPDIDIDFADRDKALALIHHVPASMERDGDLVRHNVGIYIQEIPTHPLTGIATIPYKEAEERGYFKLDFLNLNIYKDVNSPSHLDALVQREPAWELLEHQEIVDQLFHLHGHFDIVQKMKPKSVDQLAMLLALIRPAKRHLIGKDWDEIEKTIWDEPEGDLYAFKKAHSYSYAMAIVVQMNLMLELS